MRSTLLDTNILTAFFKGNTQVVAQIEHYLLDVVG